MNTNVGIENDQIRIRDFKRAEIPDGFRMIIEYKDQPVGYGHRQVEETNVKGIQGDIR